MKFEDYRALFLVASLASGLLAVSPALSLFVSFPTSGESFSELWLLGSDHRAESYPFNVRVNETNGPMYLGVRNRMGSSKYYMVYVKLRNQTQPLPDASTGNPSQMPPLYEFQFFLSDGEVWEHPVTFVIHYRSSQNDSLIVHYTSVNVFHFPVNSSSTWDSERNGFYYQLFFELWLYNATSSSFQFNDRFVGIWLNMTVS